MRPRSAHATFRPFTTCLLWLSIAVAGSAPARAANPAPLGLEIGVATQAEVRAKLAKLTTLEPRGRNKWSGGSMLGGDGAGLGIDGLEKITFVFDEREVLQGTLMTLHKNFQPAYESLRKKYKLVDKRIPFVGDAWAKFSQGSGAIILNAPHLSFEMTLEYLSNPLLARFNDESARERARHTREQDEKL